MLYGVENLTVSIFDEGQKVTYIAFPAEISADHIMVAQYFCGRCKRMGACLDSRIRERLPGAAASLRGEPKGKDNGMGYSVVW